MNKKTEKGGLQAAATSTCGVGVDRSLEEPVSAVLGRPVPPNAVDEEQERLLLELLGLVVLGLTNGRLRLVPGFESAVEFEVGHLERLVLDLHFDRPVGVALPSTPQGGPSAAASRACVLGALRIQVADVIGVDVQDGRTLVHACGQVVEQFDHWQRVVDRPTSHVPVSAACRGACTSVCPCDAGRPGVACPQQADPPVGTPHVSSPRGNSAPWRAPVAGGLDWLNRKAVG